METGAETGGWAGGWTFLFHVKQLLIATLSFT